MFIVNFILICFIFILGVYAAFNIALYRKHLEMRRKWSHYKLRSYGIKPIPSKDK